MFIAGAIKAPSSCPLLLASWLLLPCYFCCLLIEVGAAGQEKLPRVPFTERQMEQRVKTELQRTSVPSPFRHQAASSLHTSPATSMATHARNMSNHATITPSTHGGHRSGKQTVLQPRQGMPPPAPQVLPTSIRSCGHHLSAMSHFLMKSYANVTLVYVFID